MKGVVNMKKIKKLVYILFVFSFLGCAPTLKELQDSHKSAVFIPSFVKESSWAIDKSYLVFVHSMEILSFGGGPFGKEPLTADFYKVFERNSMNLLVSLLGKVNLDPDQAEYILRPEIVKVFSKQAGNFAFSNAVFKIDIRFTLTYRKKSLDQTFYETIICEGRGEGMLGTAASFKRNAHKRANDAINQAFLEAQTKLFRKLDSLKSTDQY